MPDAVTTAIVMMVAFFAIALALGNSAVAERKRNGRAACREEGRVAPAAVIVPEKLDELHEQAVAGRDGALLLKLEELRRALPEEFGDTCRDGHTAGRLEGHLLIGRAGLDVAEKRAEDFERGGRFRRWEIGGERWSHIGLDGHLAESRIRRPQPVCRSFPSHERTATYFRFRTAAFVRREPASSAPPRSDHRRPSRSRSARRRMTRASA